MLEIIDTKNTTIRFMIIYIAIAVFFEIKILSLLIGLMRTSFKDLSPTSPEKSSATVININKGKNILVNIDNVIKGKLIESTAIKTNFTPILEIKNADKKHIIAVIIKNTVIFFFKKSF